MAKIAQTYHHVVLHGVNIHNEYIINCPLTVNEMYSFTKARLNNLTVRQEVMFHDTISDNPGCPDVVSLNTYAHKLGVMNGDNPVSLNKKL